MFFPSFFTFLTTRRILLLIAAALFGYVLLRAVTLCFTYDECWTYMHYVSQRRWFLPYYDCMSANDHWLNTWLMIGSEKVFGNQPLALRLPNVLAYLLYLTATMRIALRAKGKVLPLILFAVLNGHPYLIDFFSLARGYGLSMGFMAMAVEQAMRFIEDGRDDLRLMCSLLFAAAGVLSNFVLLTFFIALVIAFLVFVSAPLLRSIKENVRTVFIRVFIIIVVAAPLLIAAVPHMLKMQKAGALFHGTTRLWQDCIYELVTQGLGDAPYAPLLHDTVMILLPLVPLVALMVVMWRLKKRTALHSFTVFFSLLFSVAILGLYLQHERMHTLYPFRRTGLWLGMSYFILLTFLIRDAWEQGWVKKITRGFSFSLVTIIVLHFFVLVDLRRVIEWPKQTDADRVAAWLDTHHRALTPERPQITLNLQLENSAPFQYYRMMRGMWWLRLCHDDSWKEDAEFFLDECQSNFDSTRIAHWDITATFPGKNCVLRRNINSLSALCEVTNAHESFEQATQYMNDTMLRREAPLQGKRSCRLSNNAQLVIPWIWTVPDSLQGKYLDVNARFLLQQISVGTGASLGLSILRNDTMINCGDERLRDYALNNDKPQSVTITYWTTRRLKAGDRVMLHFNGPFDGCDVVDALDVHVFIRTEDEPLP